MNQQSLKHDKDPFGHPLRKLDPTISIGRKYSKSLHAVQDFFHQNKYEWTFPTFLVHVHVWNGDCALCSYMVLAFPLYLSISIDYKDVSFVLDFPPNPTLSLQRDWERRTFLVMQCKNYYLGHISVQREWEKRDTERSQIGISAVFALSATEIHRDLLSKLISVTLASCPLSSPRWYM